MPQQIGRVLHPQPGAVALYSGKSPEGSHVLVLSHVEQSVVLQKQVSACDSRLAVSCTRNQVPWRCTVEKSRG